MLRAHVFTAVLATAVFFLGCKSAPSTRTEEVADQLTQPPVERPQKRGHASSFVTFLGDHDVAPEYAAHGVARDARQLVASNGLTIEWWSLETGKRLDATTLDPPVSLNVAGPSFASPDGSLFAMATDDGILLFRRGERQPIFDLSGAAELGVYDIGAGMFSPDNRWFVFESDEGAVYVIDIEAQSVAHQVAGRALHQVTNQSTVFGDTELARLSHADGSVTPLKGPESGADLYVVGAGVDDTLFAVGGAPQKKLRFVAYDPRTGEVVFQHDEPMTENDVDELQVQGQDAVREVVGALPMERLVRFDAGDVTRCFALEGWVAVECPADRQSRALETVPTAGYLYAEYEFADYSVFTATTADMKASLPVFVAVSEDADAVVIELEGPPPPLWGLDISPDGSTVAFLRQDFTVEVWDVENAVALDIFNLVRDTDEPWGERVQFDPPQLHLRGDQVLVGVEVTDREQQLRPGELIVLERDFGRREHVIKRHALTSPNPDGFCNHSWTLSPLTSVWNCQTYGTADDVSSPVHVQRHEEGVVSSKRAEWSVGRQWVRDGWVFWTSSQSILGYGLQSGRLKESDVPLLTAWNLRSDQTWSLTAREVPDKAILDAYSTDGTTLVLRGDHRQKAVFVDVVDRERNETVRILSDDDLGAHSYPRTALTNDYIVVSTDLKKFWHVFDRAPPYARVGVCNAGPLADHATGVWSEGNTVATVGTDGLVWVADVVGCAKEGAVLTKPQ